MGNGPAYLDTAPCALSLLVAGCPGNRLPFTKAVTEDIANEFFHDSMFFFEERLLLFNSEKIIPDDTDLPA
jgi:hypothetical protein